MSSHTWHLASGLLRALGPGWLDQDSPLLIVNGSSSPPPYPLEPHRCDPGLQGPARLSRLLPSCSPVPHFLSLSVLLGPLSKQSTFCLVWSVWQRIFVSAAGQALAGCRGCRGD